MNSKVRIVKISTDDISPRVLKSYFFTQGLNYPQGFKLRERYVYDYEIEFFTESTGSMLIEDKIYPVHKGDIVFRKPGQLTQGIMPYSCYLICFDLIGNSEKNPDEYEIDKEQGFQDFYSNPIIDTIPPVFHPASEEKYHQLFDLVLSEFIKRGEHCTLIMKSYMLQLLYQLYHDVQNPFANKAIPLSPHYNTIKKVVDYIEKNYQERINLKGLSQLVSLSPNYLHKVFTDAMEITPNEYITKYRLDRAKEKLIKSNLSIYEISLECGFDNIPYFSHLFKQRLGISPVEFRRRNSYAG